MTTCPRDGRPAEVGVLCAECIALVTPPPGLLSDHVSSVEGTEAAAWLIDGFGSPHPVPADRQRLGRMPAHELVIRHGSVSRMHAELVRTATGWQIRDVASRNGIRVDGVRVEGRAALADGAVIQLGDVKLLFCERPLPAATRAAAPASTHSAAAGFRAFLRGPAIELCVLGGDEDDVGGTLLHRPAGTTTWGEVDLPALEYHLLRTLCRAALAARDAPQRSRGAVTSRTLASALPFNTRYASDENVRGLVRRLRLTLDEIGADGVIETAAARGYFIAWPVSPS